MRSLTAFFVGEVEAQIKSQASLRSKKAMKGMLRAAETNAGQLGRALPEQARCMRSYRVTKRGVGTLCARRKANIKVVASDEAYPTVASLAQERFL